jgi:FixJ family two-component response regulator
MFPPSAKIILVDGDASIRRALGRIFSTAGFAWEGFASGEEFLSVADECEAACVVADTRLPGLDGLGLMRRFTAGHSGVPFIFLTEEEDERTRREARAAGAAAFFRKPIDAEALLDSIRWALHPPATAASA